jgi:hypothetical protein
MTQCCAKAVQSILILGAMLRNRSDFYSGGKIGTAPVSIPPIILWHFAGKTSQSARDVIITYALQPVKCFS